MTLYSFSPNRTHTVSTHLLRATLEVQEHNTVATRICDQILFDVMYIAPDIGLKSKEVAVGEHATY